MTFVQTTYAETMRAGLPGMIANAELANVITRTLVSGALAFGVPVQRSGDHGCLASDGQTKTGVGANGVPPPAGATIGSVTAVAPAKPGVYTVSCTVGGATTASRWAVRDPDGNYVGTALGNTAFSSQGIGFTITDAGADPVAGEAFTITVADEVGEGAFIGLSVRDPSLEPVTTIDTYKAKDNVAIMTQGIMWVVVSGAVVAGAAVFWDEATGRSSGSSGDYPIPNAVYETSGAADGDLVKVALDMRP